MNAVIKEANQEGWLFLPIKDFAHTTSGGTPRRGIAEYYNGGIPWIKSGDLNDSYLNSCDEFITELGLKKSSAKLFPSGTILIALYGATIGRLSILNFEATSNQAVCGITVPKDIETKYLFYYLLSIRQKLINQGKGGAQPNINQQIIKETIVPLAPTEQQKRIVAKIEELFSHIDAGIASLQAAKKLLKQYRQSVLKAAVTGELTKDWRKANKDKLEPASQLLERILKERRQRWEEQQLEQFKAKGKPPKDDKWKEKYKEPETYSGDGYNITHEWVMARAEQVCDFITKGTTPSKDKLTSGSGDVPFIKVYNLTFDVSLNFDLNPTYTDVETHEIFLARSKVYPGDVLMNIVGPPLGKVSIASNIHDEWNINQAIAVYRPLNGLNNKLLAYYLLSKPVVGWMQGKTKTTAGQVNLTLEISRNAPIPIPPEKEQLEIVRLIEEKLTSSDRLISQLEMQMIKAEKSKQSVLASAFKKQTYRSS